MSQRAEKEETVVEYEALNFDGLERRANYRVIAYREDMLHIFERRDAAAIIYHIIYRWQTEYRRSEVLKEIERRKKANLPQLTAEEVEHMMWVYMSYNTFVRESGHALGYNTIIRALDYLINDIKVLEQRPNHDPHYPDYEYRISKAVVRPLLKELPAEPAFTPKIPKKKERSTQMGTEENGSTQTGIPGNESTQMGTDSTQTGIATTQMGTEVYPNGGISQILTGNTQVSSQITEGTYGADAPTPAHLKEQVDEEIEKVKTTSGRLRAMKGAAFNQGDVSDSQMDIGNDAEEETKPRVPAVKLQAVAAGQAPSPLDAASWQTTVSQTPGAPPRPLAAGTADVTSRHGDAGSDQASRSLLLDSEPAQADFPPAGSTASGATTAQASGFVPPKRPRGKQPVVALTLMGSQVMQWIGEIRGAKPRMTSGNVRACNALAECDGMSKEALAAYFASIEAQNREVDLLTAAGETGNDKVGFLSFESNWPKLKKKLKGQDEKPQDKYTAASHDEERNERNLQRLRDRITARGEKPPC